MASEPRLQRRTWSAVAARAAVLIAGFVCMVAFAVVLARATLVPSPMSVRLTHTNLHPGDSIRAYLAQPNWRDAVKQVGGNVVLGMPFGVLLPVLFPRTRGLVRVVLMTAFVMLMVEGAQGLLVTGRAFDIDDVILNSTGAFAGYLLLGRRLGRALHPRREHWWHRRPDEPTEADKGKPVETAARTEEATDSPTPSSKRRLPAFLRTVRKPVR
ncbi:VanZ family protein [Streptomyces hundungensis]|uniref:VanZ family protein n=1 Tax=Streptomyces hundungensis TaxID=1077946 RepID=UPI00340BCB21